MSKIMERPSWLNCDDYHMDIMKGSEVTYKFFTGMWLQDHIPSELYKKGWMPEGKKSYTCWWYSTNPSDPSDSGEDILAYIEEEEEKDIEEERRQDEERNFRSELIHKLYGMDMEGLRKVDEFITSI